jgi:hypothetical protein
MRVFNDDRTRTTIRLLLVLLAVMFITLGGLIQMGL